VRKLTKETTDSLVASLAEEEPMQKAQDRTQGV
jgi:hypothetical protein